MWKFWNSQRKLGKEDKKYENKEERRTVRFERRVCKQINKKLGYKKEGFRYNHIGKPVENKSVTDSDGVLINHSDSKKGPRG